MSNEVERLKEGDVSVETPDWSVPSKSFSSLKEEKEEQAVREQAVASRHKFCCERY